MDSYKLYFVSCLFLPYSLCSASSEPKSDLEYDQNFTRYSHDDAQGVRNITFVNEGAQKLFSQHPELEPEFVRAAINASTSTREIRANARSQERTRNQDYHPQSPESPSEPQLTRTQLRAQAPNAYGDYNCRGLIEPLNSEKSNVYGDYNCRGKKEGLRGEKEDPLKDAKRSFLDVLLATNQQEEKKTTAVEKINPTTENDRAPHHPAQVIKPARPAQSIKHRKKPPVVPFASSDSDDEHSSDNAAQEDIDPLPYRTRDLSEATCWRCCTHILRSWMSKSKEN